MVNEKRYTLKRQNKGKFYEKMLEVYGWMEDTNFTKSSQRIYNFENNIDVFVDKNKGLNPSTKKECLVTINGDNEEDILKIKNKIEKETGFELELEI